MELKVKHADMLANAGQWREALMIFEAAVKKLPENASLLRSTAISAQMSKQNTRAVELYTRTMAAGLVDKQIYSNLIGALIELGRVDEAHRHAVDWCAAMPTDIEAMAFMALLEVEVGNHDAAARWFDFGRFVKGHTIEVPAGYDDLDDFNKAIEAVVLGMTGWRHRLKITRPGTTPRCASARISIMIIPGPWVSLKSRCGHGRRQVFCRQSQR